MVMMLQVTVDVAALFTGCLLHAGNIATGVIAFCRDNGNSLLGHIIMVLVANHLVGHLVGIGIPFGEGQAVVRNLDHENTRL